MSDRSGDAKRALRADLRERRQLLSDAARRKAAAGIREQLNRLLADEGATSISCFLSTTTEPGTREFVADAVSRGIRVLLPISRTDGLLDWAVASPDGDLSEGLFGLSEPQGERLSADAIGEVDLLVIPAAAVDRTGMRLGWGRGYFDRAIASLPHCPPVYAVVFDSEFVDEVPREVHDQPVTGVVTPTRIHTFARAAR